VNATIANFPAGIGPIALNRCSTPEGLAIKFNQTAFDDPFDFPGGEAMFFAVDLRGHDTDCMV
jgi:hypothetical protein